VLDRTERLASSLGRMVGVVKQIESRKARVWHLANGRWVGNSSLCCC
jgi:hypothetical protein